MPVLRAHRSIEEYPIRTCINGRIVAKRPCSDAVLRLAWGLRRGKEPSTVRLVIDQCEIPGGQS